MITNQPILDPILTSEAAHLLDRSGGSVRDLERRGLLRAQRTSRGIRIFSKAEVQRLAHRLAERAAALENVTETD